MVKFKAKLDPGQIAALEALRDRRFRHMEELHDSLPPGLQVCFSTEINQYKLVNVDSDLLVCSTFELNNLVDLSLDRMGCHRKVPPKNKATIEQLLQSLINLAAQTMEHKDGLLRHGCHSANEEAIELLENLGLVVEEKPEVWRWVDPLPDLAEIAKSIGPA